MQCCKQDICSPKPLQECHERRSSDNSCAFLKSLSFQQRLHAHKLHICRALGKTNSLQTLKYLHIPGLAEIQEMSYTGTAVAAFSSATLMIIKSYCDVKAWKFLQGRQWCMSNLLRHVVLQGRLLLALSLQSRRRLFYSAEYWDHVILTEFGCMHALRGEPVFLQRLTYRRRSFIIEDCLA